MKFDLEKARSGDPVLLAKHLIPVTFIGIAKNGFVVYQVLGNGSVLTAPQEWFRMAPKKTMVEYRNYYAKSQVGPYGVVRALNRGLGFMTPSELEYDRDFICWIDKDWQTTEVVTE